VAQFYIVSLLWSDYMSLGLLFALDFGSFSLDCEIGFVMLQQIIVSSAANLLLLPSGHTLA
jgi:hypothetical protein